MRRLFILALCVLGGCDRKGDSHSSLPPVRSYNGDPQNYTASGFARFNYPIKNCKKELKLQPPFSVSEDGWGQPLIRVSLDILENPKLRTIIEDGSDRQHQISYAFPSVYRAVGMRNWLQKASARTRPVEEMPQSLASKEALKGTHGIGGDTYYVGAIAPARNITVICSAVDWPNPVCDAEVDIGKGDKRYLLSFPPNAAAHFTKMITIGDRLVAPIMKDCVP